MPLALSVGAPGRAALNFPPGRRSLTADGASAKSEVAVCQWPLAGCFAAWCRRVCARACSQWRLCGVPVYFNFRLRLSQAGAQPDSGRLPLPANGTEGACQARPGVLL
jgi:hypothetical protein